MSIENAKNIPGLKIKSNHHCKTAGFLTPPII